MALKIQADQSRLTLGRAGAFYSASCSRGNDQPRRRYDDEHLDTKVPRRTEEEFRINAFTRNRLQCSPPGCNPDLKCVYSTERSSRIVVVLTSGFYQRQPRVGNSRCDSFRHTPTPRVSSIAQSVVTSWRSKARECRDLVFENWTSSCQKQITLCQWTLVNGAFVGLL